MSVPQSGRGQLLVSSKGRSEFPDPVLSVHLISFSILSVSGIAGSEV